MGLECGALPPGMFHVKRSRRLCEALLIRRLRSDHARSVGHGARPAGRGNRAACSPRDSSSQLRARAVAGTRSSSGGYARLDGLQSRHLRALGPTGKQRTGDVGLPHAGPGSYQYNAERGVARGSTTYASFTG
jgi:hypothetical protein